MAIGRKTGGRQAGTQNKVKPEDKQSVTLLAQAYAPRALEVLASIMEKSLSDASRVAAANSILDRGYGKPKEIAADADGEAPSLTVNIKANAPIGEIRVTRTDA